MRADPGDVRAAIAAHGFYALGTPLRALGPRVLDRRATTGQAVRQSVEGVGQDVADRRSAVARDRVLLSPLGLVDQLDGLAEFGARLLEQPVPRLPGLPERPRDERVGGRELLLDAAWHRLARTGRRVDRFLEGAGDGVVARLGRVRALPSRGVAGAYRVALVGGRAYDRVHADADAPLAGLGLRAGVAVVAGGAVGLRRIGASAGGRVEDDVRHGVKLDPVRCRTRGRG